MKTISPQYRQQGFSLLEVLIAILVLAIGLLGFALVQTMSVRFTQSANQRTQAVNLAADLIDQMRSTPKTVAPAYTRATFTGGTIAPCPVQIGGPISIDQNITRWQCQVRRALGDKANARVTVNSSFEVSVTVGWDDQRWEKDAARKTGAFESGKVTLEAKL